jgi:TatA/E family protein of Tat protein translocase
MLSGLTGHLPEIIIVLVVILIIWGPGKLPDVGAAMGKGIREFRKASSETHDAVMGTTTTAAPAQAAPVVQVVAAPVPAPAQPADEPVTVPADATTHQPSVSG